MSKDIIPVLLGADLNCYSVARAFAEEYGVRSHAFGKYPLGETSHSKIVDFTSVEGLEKSDILCRTLLSFADSHPKDELYLLGCTDEYAKVISENKGILGERYFCPCPSSHIMESVISKANFYELCGKYGIPHPKTKIINNEQELPLISNLGLPYPIIIKPSSSVEYWRTPFDGMKKVYVVKDEEEARSIINKIYSSGYQNSIILQDLVPGGEDATYVLTAYSDKNANVRMLCMGHVLLGEHTPKGLGNHVAIITEFHSEVAERLASFLQNIGYTGFANFDIMYDKRDGSFRVLELNPRQGRSNYYVTASGANIARLVVDDNRNTLEREKIICKEEFFWHTVPKSIIYDYIMDKELEHMVRSLVSRGKSATTLFYAEDIKNPLRLAYVLFHNARYFEKFRLYR
jgi:D-aspartate ligase